MPDGGCLRRIPGNADHQEDAEERDATGNQKGCDRIDPGNHHAEHGACGIADVGQRVAQGKRLGPLAHGQVFAEDRFGADEEQR
ncbi:hypothetical protein D3C75_1124500 [compost metagenome]